MLADYFIKPLQGSLFCKLQDIIMGRVSPYTLLEDIDWYSSKECAGKQISVKDIPPKWGKPLKNEETLEDEKVREIRTYNEVVSARISTWWLSNTEEVISSKKYWEKEL